MALVHKYSLTLKWISESYYYLWWKMGSSLYTRKQTVVNAMEARVFTKPKEIHVPVVCGKIFILNVL